MNSPAVISRRRNKILPIPKREADSCSADFRSKLGDQLDEDIDVASYKQSQLLIPQSISGKETGDLQAGELRNKHKRTTKDTPTR